MGDTIYAALMSEIDDEHPPVTSTCELLGLYRSHSQAVARAAQFIRSLNTIWPPKWVKSDDELLEWFNCVQTKFYIDVQPTGIKGES